jgi:hypothetical protein
MTSAGYLGMGIVGHKIIAGLKLLSNHAKESRQRNTQLIDEP